MKKTLILLTPKQLDFLILKTPYATSLYGELREKVSALGYRTAWYKGEVAVDIMIKGFKVVDFRKLGCDLTKWREYYLKKDRKFKDEGGKTHANLLED